MIIFFIRIFCSNYFLQCEIFSPEIIWCPVLRLRCLESIQEDLNDWSVSGLTLKDAYPPPLSNATGEVWCTQANWLSRKRKYCIELLDFVV